MSIFTDFLVSLPAGTVILMSVLLLGTLLRRMAFFTPWLDLAALGLAAFIVGVLLRLIRPRRASLTALMSGLITAALLIYLRLTAAAGDAFNPLVFGGLGCVVALIFILLGTRVGRR